jgi:hypothetical protein
MYYVLNCFKALHEHNIKAHLTDANLFVLRSLIYFTLKLIGSFLLCRFWKTANTFAWFRKDARVSEPF